MAAGRFTGLEETVNVPEEESQACEHDAKQVLRRRLCQAKDRYRTKKKLHDYMLEDGEEIDHRLRELEAENKYLTTKVNELTQVVRDHREKRCSVYMRKMETENKMLREENERLTAELDRLNKNQGHIKTLRRVEQELKHTLEEIQDDLRTKDEKIKENSLILAQKNSELEEHYDTTQDLRRERRELEARLESRQQEQILFCQRNLHKETAAETIQEEPMETESMFKRCATGLWKGIATAGQVALCVILTAGIAVTTVPIFDLVDVAVDLLM